MLRISSRAACYVVREGVVRYDVFPPPGGAGLSASQLLFQYVHGEMWRGEAWAPSVADKSRGTNRAETTRVLYGLCRERRAEAAGAAEALYLVDEEPEAPGAFACVRVFFDEEGGVERFPVENQFHAGDVGRQKKTGKNFGLRSTCARWRLE